MKKLITVPIVIILAICFMAVKPLGDIKLDKNEIFSKGDHTWVRIKNANKALGQLQHPYTFTEDQMVAILTTLKYNRTSSLSITGKTKNEWDLLTDEEKQLIAPHLVTAFAKADAKQWVDFSVMTFRGQTLVGSFRKTDGVMFVKDGELNIALRNIAIKYEFGMRLNEFDPTKGYREVAKLVSGPGQHVPNNLKNSKEYEDGNWVAINLSQPIAANPGETEEGMLQTVTKASANPAAKQPPAASSAAPAPAPAYTPAPAPAPAQPAAKERDIKERLSKLKELYDQGLITKEEYDKKRKEILDEL